MSLTNPVQIDRSAPTGNVLAGSTKPSAIIGHGVAVSGKIALKEVKTVFSLADVEALGITEGSSNNLFWYHMKEFYRKAGKGVKCKLMLVDDSVTSGAMTVKMKDMIDDTNSEYAKAILVDEPGQVYQLGFCLIPSAGYTGTGLNAMDSDSYNSISAAQALYDWANDRNIPCNIVIDGYNFTGTSSTAYDLHTIAAMAHKVSLCVAQDWDYADALTVTEHKKHSAVGTLLGSISYAAISQNIGEYEDPNLSLTQGLNWVTPGLSNHTKVRDRFDDLDTLDTKGYIFALTLPGVNGTRWSGDWTATAIQVDSDNNMSEFSISLGRTEDEIRRRLRAALIVKIKTRQRIDPATGKLDPKTVETFNGLGDVVFEDMVTEGHISGGRTIVDPNSNLSVAPRILNVNYAFVPIGQIDEIKGSLKVKTQLS
jgi:hypothetical protein